MMYAIKGAWVGQTFALAKSNESEGKKIRIRRSKEERKTMVESFIKKYQSSNNGNFPSLNLTHKEVGGSFYTVREIVREIIQENRVLGPAKLFAEELNINQFDEEYPLSTISTEPQTPLYMTSNGSPLIPSHQKGNDEHQVSISDGPCHEHDSQMFDKQQIVNGSMMDVNTEESAKSTYEELQTIKSLKTEKRVESLADSAAVVTSITADVEVETFPLRPLSKIPDNWCAVSGVKNSTETLEKNEIEKVNLETSNGRILVDQIPSSKNSDSVGGQNGSILAGVATDKNSDLVKNEVVEEIADPQLKSSDCSTKEGGTVSDTVLWRNVEVEVSHNDGLTSEINEENQGTGRSKELNAANGKTNDTYGSSSKSRQESKTPKANMIVQEACIPRKETSQNGSNPTVLESWERASRNSSEMEANPFLAILKSCATAFMKFWFE